MIEAKRMCNGSLTRYESTNDDNRGNGDGQDNKQKIVGGSDLSE